MCPRQNAVVPEWDRQWDLKWQWWGQVQLSVTGTPFSLVRKMLPFTGTWVPFYDIV